MAGDLDVVVVISGVASGVVDFDPGFDPDFGRFSGFD